MTRSLTKSTLSFIRMALAIATRTVPRYGYRSRKDYTQPQLLTLLLLRQFWQVDYRTLVLRVAEWAEVRRALGLTQVPHYSTLCYAEHRLLGTGATAPPAGRKKGEAAPR